MNTPRPWSGLTSVSFPNNSFMDIIKIWVIVSFAAGIIIGLVKEIKKIFPSSTDNTPTENDYDSEDQSQYYDSIIDDYSQLVELLDRAYNAETDEKEKAALLEKKLTAMEKLQITIEKREKLE